MLRMPVVAPWGQGTALVVETGMTGATMNVYCGLHEAPDMAFVLHLLRPGDLYLEVGAVTGTVPFSASRDTTKRAVDLFRRTLSSTDAPPQANTSHNQLWIRDLAFVQQRCHTASAMRVGGVEL